MRPGEDTCWTCGERPRHGQLSMCLSCASANGFAPCPECGDYFRADGLDEPRRARCASCRRAGHGSGSRRARLVAQASRLIPFRAAS